jgi:peptidoglycan/LPS O-acetylase OafA/YrhL
MKSYSKHLPYLDGWRGLAILIVLASHFIPPMYQFGDMGVGVFFVLSGYLMSDLLFIKKVALPYFFIRRASRILPAFVFFVFLMLVYANWFQAVKYSPSLVEIIATLTFLGTYIPNDVNIWANTWPIAHMWSLNVEEHSYLWLALGVVVTGGASTKSRVTAFMLLSVAATIFFLLIYRMWPPEGASKWELRSECASIGLLAAAAYRVFLHFGFFQLKTKIPKWAPLLTLITAIMTYSAIAPVYIEQVAGPLLLAFTINHLEDTFYWIRGILSNPLFTWFGTCSFSLYLWQQPFYLALRGHHIDSGAYAFLLALITGAASYYLLENPSRIYLNKKLAPLKK